MDVHVTLLKLILFGQVMDLMTRGTFSEAEAEAALARAGGEMEEASRQLNQKSLDVFRNRLWQPTENPACTSAKFEADIRDENRDIEVCAEISSLPYMAGSLN